MLNKLSSGLIWNY